MLLGNGDGTFQVQASYPTDAYPYYVAISDLSGDGRSDLAVANYDSNTVSVLLNSPPTVAGPAYTIDHSAPAVSISDATISEGDSGTRVATFTVTRSGGTAAFDVDFATADGTATLANGDYVANSGTLHFDASVNTQTISVIINGDTTVEPDEAFFVNLTGATNGAGISDSLGIGTIINDDFIAGSVSISDATISEGDTGTQLATFTVTRSGGTAAFDVDFATADGTATLTDSDYDANSGTLHFDTGINTQTISVAIIGDTTFEPDETFSVNLTEATNGASISDSLGIGTITNDDVILVDGVIIIGSNHNDLVDATHTVRGQPLPTNASDFITGNSGNDDLSGFGGNDTLNGGAGNDILHGGDGNDILQVAGTEGRFDVFDGGPGIDTLQVLGTNGIVLAGFDAADSSIEHWLGNGHEVNGTSAADSFDFSGLTSLVSLTFVDAGNGNDTIIGSSFADDLRGGAGNDILDGGGGNDTLNGGAGHDILHGGAGDDILQATGGQDTSDVFDGGSGTDTLQVTGLSALTLAGFDATDSSIEIWVGNGNGVNGTSAADSFDFSGLTSLSGLKFVNAGDGYDTIIGSNFADDLRGGNGNDTLNGGGGNDLLQGNGGYDTFVFADGGGADTIKDYQSGHDQFDLTGVTGVHDFGDLTLSQINSQTVLIDFDGILGGDTLTIQHTTIAILNAHQGDFLFA